MSVYHVKNSGLDIIAGPLNESENQCNYSYVTNEAVCAVRDFILDSKVGVGIREDIECIANTKQYFIGEDTGGFRWAAKDGRIVELRVSVKEAKSNT